MRSPLITPFASVLLAFGPPAALLPGTPAVAATVQPSPEIAYQGRLLQNTLPVTGLHLFDFQILDSASNLLWDSGSIQLPVDNGLYSVVLGSTVAGIPAIPPSVMATANLVLQVTVDGQALTPNSAIVPAFQASSAFELLGSFAGDLGGTQSATIIGSLQGYPLDLSTTPPTLGQGLLLDGSKWVAGSVTGSQGPAGAIGATGATGPAGPAGATGPQGATGNQGVQGSAGPAGPIGSQGLPGVQGPIGPTGAQGATGPASLEWRGNSTR